MAQVKISELTAKGSALQGTDLLEISQLVGSAYVSKSVNGGDIIDAAQSGMQSELISGTNIKTINSSSILGSGDLSVGTVTSVGLITDALGTDVSVSGSPITGSGSITLSIPTASALNTGKLSKTDWTTFNNKQDALVSGTNIKTINSTSLLGSGNIAVQATLVSGTNIKTINGNSLLGSGDLIVGGGSLTIGTTAITSGTIGRVLFQGTGNVLQQSSNLFWDNTNNALTITTGKTFSAYQSSQPNDALKITASNDGAVLGIQNSNASGFSGIEYLNNSGAAKVFTGFNNNNGQEFRFNNFTTGGYIDFLISTSALRIANTRNILIGTTTDSGYKLDVNGTARVQGKLSVNTPTAASAVMEVTSTTQGFLPPRMTTTQKNAISSPAAGLVVYDTTLNKLCVYTTAWETITSI